MGRERGEEGGMGREGGGRGEGEGRKGEGEGEEGEMGRGREGEGEGEELSSHLSTGRQENTAGVPYA